MAMVHIIGAGVSGLAAATQLAGLHVPVRLYEASAGAGGRARSSRDAKLGTIDHGLHVMSGATPQMDAYLARIEAGETVVRVGNPLTFPTAPLVDYLGLLPLVMPYRAGHAADLFDEETILRDAWASRASRLLLHTPLAELSRRAARKALFAHARAGRKGLSAAMVRDSLDASFVAPALAHLEYHGAGVYFNHALKALEQKDGAIVGLRFARQVTGIEPQDVVILALPAAAAQQLLPEIQAPGGAHCSITVHFAVAHREVVPSITAPVRAPVDAVRYGPGRISVMVRIADHLWHGDQRFLAARLWRWLQQQHLYLAEEPLPPSAIWREKQAGHSLTPGNAPQIGALPARLVLAGDWLQAETPSSIETAIASGHAAAVQAQRLIGPRPLRRQG